MKAWIVWGMLGGLLLAVPVLVQAQAGAQARSQATAARQQTAPQQQASAQAAPASQGQAQQAPPAAPTGRRDPFRPIEIKRAEDIIPNCTQSGIGGILVGQVQLRGIASDVQGRWIGVIDNKTGRAYFLRQGDQLCNGVVARVDEGSLVLEERTMDSFGRTRTREVVLRPEVN
jgi:hypothetical protein